MKRRLVPAVVFSRFESMALQEEEEERDYGNAALGFLERGPRLRPLSLAPAVVVGLNSSKKPAGSSAPAGCSLAGAKRRLLPK